MHQNCRCWQVPISPGREAPQPFCDFLKLLDQMPEHNREAAIGASNYRLLKRGLAKWSDIVTPYRVRDFHEVVSLLKLPVATMVAAGVRRYLAIQAQQCRDQTPEQTEARHRAGLYAGLDVPGQSQERLLGGRLSNAVGVVGGGAGIAMVAQMPGHGAELAGLISDVETEAEESSSGRWGDWEGRVTMARYLRLACYLAGVRSETITPEEAMVIAEIMAGPDAGRKGE